MSIILETKDIPLDLLEYFEPINNTKKDVWRVTTKPFTGWTETVRWVRVEQDAVSDDTMRIVFPNCPICAGRFGQLANQFYGEHASDLWNYIEHIYSHPVLKQIPDFFDTHKKTACLKWLDNLGSFVHECFLSATGRSIETRKMGLFLSTNPSCSFFAETLSRIDDKLEQLLFFVLQTHIHGNSILPDEMDAHLWGQIPSRKSDKFSSDNPFKKNCLCTLYHKQTEKSSHFATFPPDLITPCILAGCPENGLVLDPFAGTNTTGMVAYENRRNYIGIELNKNYIKLNRADKAKDKYSLFEKVKQ